MWSTISPNRRAALAFAAALALHTPACAGESSFGYVYTTDTLPAHKFEVQQWITDNEGQAHGRYHGLGFRTELEYGLTNNFQIALYANNNFVDAHDNSVARRTEGLDIVASHDPTKSISEWHNDGFSAEFLWRVMSPYKKPFGLAFYVEPSVGPREDGVEVRAIAQKNFRDDRLVFAANAWIEFVREQGTNLGAIASADPPSFEKTKATYLEFDLGASYRFRPKWSLGLEFRNHNEFEGWSLAGSDKQHTAFFLGPNVHYAAQRWFVTLSALRQLAAVAYTDEQRAQIYRGRLYGNEHATWDGIRLIIGRTF